jgi:hypothetical protein
MEATVANILGKTILSGALAATLAAPAWAQIEPVLPVFSGEAVVVDPYNELLDQMMPRMLGATAFPMVQTIAVDVQFTPRLTDLDAYNATLAVLADGVLRDVDVMSAFALVPGYRMLHVWEAPSADGK